MTNETRKIIVLVLTAFIIISAFIPSLNPLPTVNNSTSETPLIQLYTDSINSSHSSDVESWLQDAIGISGYGDEYLLPLDNLIFILIGVLLVMFIISVIILVVSKKGGGFALIRVIAILNTLTYAALIGLTIFQNNKLNNDTWGFASKFIKIRPSTGAYIGFIASFVLIFIAIRGRLQVATQHNNNTQYIQKPHNMNEEMQGQTGTQPQPQNSVNISEKVNDTITGAKGKVDNFLTSQKERVKTEYETAEKDFKGLGLEDIISSVKELCYSNSILKYIMPYVSTLLIIQTVIIGITLLFGLNSYSRFSTIGYIFNSDIFFMVIVAFCLIKKNYLVVAIYETLLILLNFMLYGGFSGRFIGTFAWINILVLILIDVYAIKMTLKNIELNKEANKHIQAANNIQEQILCQACGKASDKDVKFCVSCGNKLS